jgi:hypothetical protein
MNYFRQFKLCNMKEQRQILLKTSKNKATIAFLSSNGEMRENSIQRVSQYCSPKRPENGMNQKMRRRKNADESL